MNEGQQAESDKRLINRSASYPSISIAEAISFVSQIKKSFPTSNFKREDISAVLKKSAIHRDIAAAVHYGLVDRTGDSYKLSSRVQSILTFVTDEEKKEAIINCFSSPKLYIELIERFKGHAVPPDQQLRAILTRFHNITEAASPQAADIFIENALFAGVLNEHRILLGESNLNSITKDVATDNLNSQNTENPNELPKENPTLVDKKKPLLLEEMNGSIDLKIHLSEKKVAHLIYPDNVNEKDIQILKLQLEALALTL